MSKTLTLQDVLKKPGAASKLARKLKISYGHMSDMKLGRRGPSLDVAFAIEDATGVPAKSLLRKKRKAA